MAIAALIIALFAAAFTGYHVYLAFKEQKLRLRPQVYIDKVVTNISPNAITFKFAIQNVGLLPAKNVTISPVLKMGNITKELSDEDIRSKAIILPNQICWNAMQVAGEERNSVLQGKAKLHAEISVEYESNDRKYYFRARYEFNSAQKSWAILDGDAN